MSYKTFVVINPNSANKDTGKKLNYIKECLAVLGSFEFVLTEDKNHATKLTKDALNEGFDRIIAVGGDGTFNEVVNGFFQGGYQINEDAVLGFISRGTGSDLVRTLKLPKDIRSSISIIKGNRIKEIDLGKATYTVNNKTETRFFINIANVGIGSEVAYKVNNSSKVLGGFLSFLNATITTVVNYKNKETEIVFDDNLKLSQITNNIIIGNGKFFGGGMKVLPDADLQDGFFDVMTIGDISKLGFFQNIPKIYNGTHVSDPNVTIKKAKKITITAKETLRVEFDGEAEGFTPVTFEIVPKSLSIIV